jgi:hypothetical protein
LERPIGRLRHSDGRCRLGGGRGLLLWGKTELLRDVGGQLAAKQYGEETTES